MAETSQALMKGLGEAIRSQRRKRGWTLQRLANLTGMSLSFLSQVEVNACIPSVETLWKIGQALDLTVTQLFSLAEAYTRLPDMEMSALKPPPLPK